MMMAVATYDEAQEHPGLQDLPVLELVHPMPGFPDALRFTLVHLDEDGVLGALRSLDQDGLQFLVVPAAQFFPAYEPVVSDEVVADLAITSVQDVLVLLVVHAGADLASTTVNLRAPLLVNTGTLRAAQVILDDPALAVAAPLVS